ncbi:MAG: hypothetical protein Q9195_003336 [Heterodermia aff. obscurata]
MPTVALALLLEGAARLPTLIPMLPPVVVLEVARHAAAHEALPIEEEIKVDTGDDHAPHLVHIHLAVNLPRDLHHQGLDGTQDHPHHRRDETPHLTRIVAHVLHLHMSSKRGIPPLDAIDTIVVRTLQREIAQLDINKTATIVTESVRDPPMAAVTGSGTHSPAYRNSRAPPVARSPGYRERSPPRRGFSPVPISPPREREPAPYRQRSPPPRRQSPAPYAKDEYYKDDYRNGGPPEDYETPMPAPPNGNFQNGSRAPPSGPGSSYRDSPSGPPSAPLSMSAHSRAAPPFRPRGGPGGYNREPRDPSFQGPPPRRGGYGSGPPPSYRGGHQPRHYDSGPPAGPRTGYNERNPSVPYNAPPFRPNNSSSTTYPRTQRFNNPAPAAPKIENHPSLSGMPSIVPGGKVAPSGLDPVTEKRLMQLEEDKRKLEEAIAEKQRAKRLELRDWDNKERESKRDGLRSDLAEQGLEKMGMGEGVGMSGAAF